MCRQTAESVKLYTLRSNRRQKGTRWQWFGWRLKYGQYDYRIEQSARAAFVIWIQWRWLCAEDDRIEKANANGKSILGEAFAVPSRQMSCWMPRYLEARSERNERFSEFSWNAATMQTILLLLLRFIAGPLLLSIAQPTNVLFDWSSC